MCARQRETGLNNNSARTQVHNTHILTQIPTLCSVSVHFAARLRSPAERLHVACTCSVAVLLGLVLVTGGSRKYDVRCVSRSCNSTDETTQRDANSALERTLMAQDCLLPGLVMWLALASIEPIEVLTSVCEQTGSCVQGVRVVRVCVMGVCWVVYGATQWLVR